MEFNLYNFNPPELKKIYQNLVKPRLIEEKMLILLRQGKISKWFSGIGQEAVSVGCAMAMEDDEYILPMHRNLGVFTSRGIPLSRLFAQFQGKMSGFTKGRDRSFHFGTQEYKIIGMISHLGPQMGLADGIALGHILKKEKKATLVFTGDGGASEGDFHEALNVAAVWDLPVMFVIENNGYGLSTPTSEQYRCKSFVDKGIGYGMQAEKVDGNNILEVYSKALELLASMREKPRPIILECETFRMRGHEEASGTKYVPKELFEKWELKNPVKRFEEFLLEENIFPSKELEKIKKEISQEIEEALQKAFSEAEIEPSTKEEINDLFAENKVAIKVPEAEPVSEKRLIDAVHDALDLALKKHQDLVFMGQDIAKYGGVFKATEGLSEKYGVHRVRNTPLCESAIVGTAMGLSIKGYKAMVEMQFADFVTEGFNQIVNNLAKAHWRWGQNVDVVIRMPTGAGVAAGPFHSQSNEAWFVHTAGLKVVYPSSAADAKGLLLRSFEDTNPIMFFEHKALYRSTHEQIPDGYYSIPIGKANLVSEGADFSIITYGLGVHWALEYIRNNNLSADVLDLRTLSPLDQEAIFATVKKTNRALVLHEDNLTAGVGAEIAALINENCFEYLDAPVLRCASLDTPVPFTRKLEENFLAKNFLKEKIETLLSY